MKEMIKAYKKDMELLHEIITAPTVEDQLFIWWLGQSGYLIKWFGRYVLIDPYLSDSLTKKYEYTDKPHIRMSEQVIDPALLNFIDIVTSSHNHTDHLDAETLLPIINNNADIKLVIPEANRAFVADRLKCALDFPIGLTHRSMHTFHGGISIHGIEAAHETISYDAEDRPHCMGYVLYLGDFCIYHSGDSIPFEGLEYQLQRHHIDIAFLPINGRSPERKVAGNFTIQEACTLAKNIKTKLLIPGHYDMFEFNTVDVNEFVTYASKENIPYNVLQHGELFVYNL